MEHKREAERQLEITAGVDEGAQRAIAHALIAIAEEMKEFREHAVSIYLSSLEDELAKRGYEVAQE